MTKKTVKKVVKKTIKKASVKKVAKKALPKKKSPKKVVTKKAVVKKTNTKKVATKKKLIKKVEPKIDTPLKVGDNAPDFTLMNQEGMGVSLKDYLGKHVVVYFYPRAMTPGCTIQACELRNAKAELEEKEIVVLGISADPVKLLKKFEEKEKLNFTLLSDPEHKVIQAYRSWGPKKFMGKEFDGILRQSFLIDKEGKIIHIMDKVNTKTHHDDVLKVFATL